MLNKYVMEFDQEMRLCFPEKWAEMSATQRAKRVALDFKDCGLRSMKWEKKGRQAAAESKQKKRATLCQKYHERWNNIIMRAHGVYGDLLSEYSIAFNGEDGPEMLSSGAWEPTEEIEEACMREALFTVWAWNMIRERNKYQRAIQYWKKYCR